MRDNVGSSNNIFYLGREQLIVSFDMISLDKIGTKPANQESRLGKPTIPCGDCGYERG